ncbi:MAG: hypothetical protein OMM_07856 [Candidatus Magnetoglobus multicellularis str. Araruama]|uniref:TIR domain-containing protein n=1 Tax=Candidatus Magnetoglobus multicellularis str. Araruama TaxID=890399 RepID=A0A1V1PAD3_9BACT|nr:MAG: hypothetical protein OMM_07856 [Candidatus Magnetoglobus multicellularis str. Araruama]
MQPIQTTESTDQTAKDIIYISYSPKDRSYLEIFIDYLMILKIKHIDYRFDHSNRTIDDWSDDVQQMISSAQMTICLLTNQYLSSALIQEKEFPAIQVRQKQGMVLFPVLIKDCLWHIIPWFDNTQIYPKSGVPLQEMDDLSREKTISQIMQDIPVWIKTNNHVQMNPSVESSIYKTNGINYANGIYYKEKIGNPDLFSGRKK